MQLIFSRFFGVKISYFLNSLGWNQTVKCDEQANHWIGMKWGFQNKSGTLSKNQSLYEKETMSNLNAYEYTQYTL